MLGLCRGGSALAWAAAVCSPLSAVGCLRDSNQGLQCYPYNPLAAKYRPHAYRAASGLHLEGRKARSVTIAARRGRVCAAPSPAVAGAPVASVLPVTVARRAWGAACPLLVSDSLMTAVGVTLPVCVTHTRDHPYHGVALFCAC